MESCRLLLLGRLLLTIAMASCENIARNKTANQTGVYDGMVASRAVDGQYGREGDQYYCAHPENKERGADNLQLPAEWWVDLQDSYIVDNVTLYNTYDSHGASRLEYFVISVSDSATAGTDCDDTYTGKVPRGGNVTITCDIRGRYIHFRRVGGFQSSLVTLCEVEVYGSKAFNCSRCSDVSACSQETGCATCSVGKKPPDCNDCPNGYYGESCNNTCGRCGNGAPCDKQTGICPGASCEIWYTGDKCDIQIVPPRRINNESMTLGVVTNSSVEVTWEQIRGLPAELAEYYRYRVEYGRTGAVKQPADSDVTHNASVTHNHQVIYNLDYNMEYGVQISYSRYFQGTHNWSTDRYPEVTIKTTCGWPELRNITELQKINNPPAIEVFFLKTAPNARCNNVSVILEYRLKRVISWSKQTITDISRGYVRFSPSAGGEYEVRLTTVNDERFESSSGIKTINFIGTTSLPTTITTTTTKRAAETATTGRTMTSTVTSTTATGESVATSSALPTSTDTSIGADKQVTPRKDDNAKIAAPIVVVGCVLIAGIVVIIIFVKQGRIRLPQKKRRYTRDDILIDPTGGISNSGFTPTTSGTPLANSVFPPTPPASPQTGKNKWTALQPLIESKQHNKYSVDPAEAKNSLPEEHHKFVRPTPVDVNNLENYVKNRSANMNIYEVDYKTFAAEDLSRCELAQVKQNKLKNRFANIYAYDDNRVILEEEYEGEGDYINANHITGYNGPNEYIATQGVKPKIIADLYRMVWQYKANRIVMVANLVDDGKERCAQYWPKKLGETVKYGNFSVTNEGEEVCADYTTRILTVTKLKESRTIRQFHFTSWEDKNKPLHGPITLFSFYNKVHSFDKLSEGPMVVHCSAGVGRTGTFIAFDILVNQARAEGMVDIYGCVEKLREQRMLMVQTKEQYVFLHNALSEYLKCGKTSYSVDNFLQVFKNIMEPNNDIGGISEVDRQFNMVMDLKARPNIQSLNGLREANKAKNRDLSIIPDDDNRPYLMTRHKPGNNYINASFVPSFKKHGYYIVTQMPLTNTIIDFWRLVYDMDCHSIVMLNVMDQDDPTCLAYWPEEDEPKQRYGPIEVELLRTDADNTSTAIRTRDFRVLLAADKMNTDAEAAEGIGIIVRQFQLLSWPKNKELPPAKSDLIDLFDILLQWQHTRTRKDDHSDHTIVHCLNGVERSGVFCGASFTLERMKIEQEVDAYLAVRYVSRKRPQFISTKEQYVFLYEIALEYLDRFHQYANFEAAHGE